MNELQFAHRMRQALDRRAAQLSPAILARLREAREQSLAVQASRETEPRVALAGPALRGERGLGRFSLRWLLPFAVLVAGLLAIHAWQKSYRIAVVEDVDSRLLTDELPIDAYLDKGFQAWLKKRGAEQ